MHAARRVGRAFGQLRYPTLPLIRGDKTKAFTTLRQAKNIAPTQTRYHPMVHETIRALAREETRTSDTIRGFATWCGIHN